EGPVSFDEYHAARSDIAALDDRALPFADAVEIITGALCREPSVALWCARAPARQLCRELDCVRSATELDRLLRLALPGMLCGADLLFQGRTRRALRRLFVAWRRRRLLRRRTRP